MWRFACSLLSSTPSPQTSQQEAKMTILQLPPEIFHNILVFVDPEDLGTLPLTCRHFNDFISGNNALCRDMYLRYLDDPPTTNFNYTEELHDVVRLAKVCSSQQLFEPDNARAFILEELPFVHRVVTHLLANSVPPPPSPRDPAPQIIRTSRTETFNPSNNATVLNSYFSSNYLSRSAFFKQSTIFARLRQTNNVHPRDGFVIGDDATPPEHRQQSAKLHCLYGIADTLKDITNRRRYRYAAPVSSPARSIYGLACSKVYDLREYRRHGTAWGPFYGGDHGDGLGLRVDWEKTEAILLVIGANLHIKGLADFEGVENVWGRPFAGVWEKSYIPWTLGRLKLEREREEERLRGDVDEDELKKRQEKEELEKQDPYGVGGTWLRIVCFLDYSDFFLFNFPPANHPRNNAGPREAIDRGEATRLILMKVRVTEVEKATEPGDDPNWPVVHFEGISRALDSSWDENADSELIGTARMTKEGEVRWTTYSIYSGEERWKSEGFQLGGVKSARGVIGNWFDKDYNDRGPCGPTAFWKVADHEYSGDDTDMLLSNLLPLIVDQSDEEEEEEAQIDYDSESSSSSSSSPAAHRPPAAAGQFPTSRQIIFDDDSEEDEEEYEEYEEEEEEEWDAEDYAEQWVEDIEFQRPFGGANGFSDMMAARFQVGMPPQGEGGPDDNEEGLHERGSDEGRWVEGELGIADPDLDRR